MNEFFPGWHLEVHTGADSQAFQCKGNNLAKNFGQHNAIMAGLNYTEGDLILGMDDDMQNHPSQIPQFLDKIQEGYDIVFGVLKNVSFQHSRILQGQ